MRRARLLIVLGTTVVILTGLPAAVGAADPAFVSVGDVSVSEPSNRNGTVAVEVPVTVHGASSSTITVGWATVAGSAGSPDFVNASGSLVIPAGAAGGAIAVEVRADKVDELAESFSVEITSASGASAADESGIVTIRPTASGLSVGDVALTEPDTGLLGVAFPVPRRAAQQDRHVRLAAAFGDRHGRIGRGRRLGDRHDPEGLDGRNRPCPGHRRHHGRARRDPRAGRDLRLEHIAGGWTRSGDAA